jgi:hypothetical protein
VDYATKENGVRDFEGLTAVLLQIDSGVAADLIFF